MARYTVDEDWLIPHFEKMLYDNVQFIILLSKYLKINPNNYFAHKLKQTINFLKEDFINKEFGLLGSAYDADSDGVEGKYYVYQYKEKKNIKDIGKYFEIRPEGNWEGKIILKETKLPPTDVIEELKKIRKKRNKPFFDNKTQLDLNSLWVSSLVQAHNVLPGENYLELAESFFSNIEKKFMKNNPYHSYSHNLVFLEDYAYLINTLIDLGDSTMKIEYKIKAKKLCSEAIEKFYVKEKNIFQKNKLTTNDLFFSPIDISDHTLSNGNSIMLINFTRLGCLEEAKKLALSLNGYLNIYKNHMVSSIKAIDFLNENLNGKKCSEQGCEI